MVTSGSERLPLILDVDTGIDDAMALAFAVAAADADLVAVTTVAGNVDVARTTANTLAVLDHLGAGEVPVHRGASRPLVRPHRDATYLHDVSGLGNARLAASERATGADRGPAAIIRLAMARPGELTLVCTGPLTNLAIALNVAPELPHLLRRVVIMGGAFFVPGNITPHAEFNAFVDPEATAQVFAAPFPDLTVVGLDVTHDVRLRKATWEVARSARVPSPGASLVAEVCRQAFTERGFDAYYLHDPLAVAVALDPHLVRGERIAVEVMSGEPDRGMTRPLGPGSVLVAREVDVDRFESRFAAVLGLGADVESCPISTTA